MEPRKNLKRVMAAFAEIRNPKSEIRNLVVVGRAGWGEQVMPAKGVKFLYNGAELFLFPSLYEGFGLPILEAMTVGCPVVTSDRGSLKEVAGEAAVLVDPENEESIAMGIEEAVEKRSVWTAKGLAQAAKFSWEKAARETLRVYEEAAG